MNNADSSWYCQAFHYVVNFQAGGSWRISLCLSTCKKLQLLRLIIHLGTDCGFTQGHLTVLYMVLQYQYGHALLPPVSLEAFFLLLDFSLCYRNFEIYSPMRFFVISLNTIFRYTHFNLCVESCVCCGSCRTVESPTRRNSLCKRQKILENQLKLLSICTALEKLYKQNFPRQIHFIPAKMFFCQCSLYQFPKWKAILTKGYFLTVGIFALMIQPKSKVLSGRTTASKMTTLL